MSYYPFGQLNYKDYSESIALNLVLNLDILKLGFPCHDVADDVTNLDKCARMINDKGQNLNNYIHLPCKMDQIGIVNIADTQCNILFGHSAPQTVKHENTGQDE